MADNTSRWGELITHVKQALISINNLSTTIGKVFPQWTGSTANAATGGAATALPAQPAGYMNLVNPVTGANVKVPFYNP